MSQLLSSSLTTTIRMASKRGFAHFVRAKHFKRHNKDNDLPNVSLRSKVAEIHKRVIAYERAEASADPLREYRLESEAAERLLQSDPAQYRAIFDRRNQLVNEEKEKKREEEAKVSEMSSKFPFHSTERVHISNVDNITEDNHESSLTDQGFFVTGNLYVDEYRAGNVNELPEDELIVPSRELYGSPDAVETIDFQMPGQSLHESVTPRKSADGIPIDDEYDEGGEVEAIEWSTSDKKCSGCGANFHCKDEGLPGFVPPSVFVRLDRKDDSLQCRRCHLIKSHSFLPNVHVCEVDYESLMSHLRGRQEVLILLVVDILDLPGSIHRALPNIIGKNKPMIVVANKVDLLPPDARCGYLRRFKLIVEKALRDEGFADSFNILHTALVSSKTGYGIEDLITEIHLKWTNIKSTMRNDIYLVGCTNAGKSTLFNSLLQSDMCKVRAVDVVERATTSIWPGTTLSLLKFPVMRPSPYRLELRRRRLMSMKAWQQKENYDRKRMLQQTGDNNYAVLVEHVQHSFKESEDELQPKAIACSLGKEVEEKKRRPWSLDDPIFAKGVWCYDTPGTVSGEQLLELLSLRELVNVVPTRILRPRTAIISPGSSLLIGGIGRLDILDSQRERPIFVTVFASDSLPLNVMETSTVKEFLQENEGKEFLGAPIGDKARLQNLPEKVAKKFQIARQEEEYKHIDDNLVGMADVVFSSIGWAMVSSHSGSVSVEASLLGGRGLTLRTPPMLPYSVQLRGARIPGTNFYRVKPVEFPVNVRRIKAKKNRRKYKQK